MANVLGVLCPNDYASTRLVHLLGAAALRRLDRSEALNRDHDGNQADGPVGADKESLGFDGCFRPAPADRSAEVVEG